MTLTMRFSLVFSALALTAVSADAQRMNLVEGREVLAFARGLAAEYSFVDLAAEVLADAEKRGFPSSMEEQVAIEKCDIFSIGALSMRDPIKRHELFEEALQAYSDFIDQNSRSEALPDAEAGFVTTSGQFAQSMLAALDDARGEGAEKLRARRIEVLSAAVVKTGDLIEDLKSLEDPREKDKRRLYDLMLNRGRMLTETARSQDDPTFSFEQATITLEELSFVAGEGSPYSLRAFDAMGNNLVAQGNPGDAAYMFQYVVDSAIPSDRETWETMIEERELSKQDMDTRWLFVELSTRGVIESFSEAGELEEALRWAMHFYNTLKQDGFTLSVPGHLSMLEVSRSLLNAGGFIGGNLSAGTAQWFPTEEAMKDAGHVASRNQRSATDLALSIAQDVKTANRGNSLQVRAQKLIKDIISQPGVKKSPDVLMDAAMGEYGEGNWSAAIDAFKDVLDAIAKEDAATRQRYGADLMYHLGRSYRSDNRNLEAALCFKEGLDVYLGDEDENARNAQGYASSIKTISKQLTSEDPILASMLKAAEQSLLDHAVGNTVEILKYKRAETARKAKKFDEAIKLYQKIEPGSDYYEKSLVNIGVCKLRDGTPEEALTIFDGYLTDFVTDPKNAIAQSETLKTRRREAKASAEFYRGYIYYKRADGKPISDPNWPKVVELLHKFYLDFPEQTRLATITMRYTALAHLAQRNIEEATAILDAMLERFPNDDATSNVAIKIYKRLDQDRKAAITAKDDEKSDSLLRKMANLIHNGNGASTSVSFDNLRKESKHWMELGEWEEAERVLLALRDKFGEEKAEDMQKYILPDLAEAYMRLMRVNDALEILTPLNGKDLKPSKRVVVNYCRAVTGWVVENDQGRPTIVPGGTEDVALFEDVSGKLLSISTSADKWNTGEWCEFYFDYLYCQYAWSKLDSAKANYFRSRVSSMIGDMGPEGAQFPNIEEIIKNEGGEIEKRLGNNILRKRYVWLSQKAGL